MLFVPKFVIVDIGFNPHGHGPSFNQKLAEALALRGWSCEAWIPRNREVAATEQLVYRACLPELPRPGSVRAMARYGLSLWRSLAVIRTDARILSWPIANVFYVLIASLASPFLGLGKTQILAVNFAPRTTFSAYYVVEQVSLAWLRLAIFFGLPLKIYTTMDSIDHALRALGCPTHGLLVSYAHQGGSRTAPPDGPTRFCYLGRGCDSKGLGWLLETLYHLRPLLASGQMTWAIQAVLVSRDETLSAQQLERFRQDPLPNVELLESYLTEEEYVQQLDQCHYVVTPYDPAVYRELFSGVVTEALAAGRPVITTDGTWASQNVLARGCGLSSPFGDCEAFAKVLGQALEVRSELCKKAWDLRGSWSSEHSYDAFVSTLLSSATP